MTIDKNTSERLSLLRFPLIAAIVYLHAYGISFNFKEGSLGDTRASLALLVQDLISQGLTRIAVPLFFLMSGYLLFSSLEPTLNSYLSKLRSRGKSLLVPYLFWNIAVLLIFGIAQSLPVLSNVFSGQVKPVSEMGGFDLLNAIFGLNKSPIASQFWFIRDLMLLVLLSPLFIYVGSRVPKILLSVLFVQWMGNFSIIYCPSPEAQFFFFLGFIWAKGFNTSWIDKQGAAILFVYLLLLAADASLKDWQYSYQLHKISLIPGLASTWYLAGQALSLTRLKEVLIKLSPYSFFVYAAHEPMLTGLKKGSFKFFQPEGSFEILAIYFICPLAVILITLAAAKAVNKLCPPFYRVITGGRA